MIAVHRSKGPGPYESLQVLESGDLGFELGLSGKGIRYLIPFSGYILEISAKTKAFDSGDAITIRSRNTASVHTILYDGHIVSFSDRDRNPGFVGER